MSEYATQQRLEFDQDDFGQGAEEAMAIPLSDTGDEPLVKQDRPERGELIEPGRALALTDFVPPDITAGERLVRLAYRLGVPGSTLAAPFRKRSAPRLLATVESPIAGDRVAGMALRAGHFLVFGVKAPIGLPGLAC